MARQWLLLPVLFFTAMPFRAALLVLDPPSPTASISGVFTLDVRAESVVDLYAYGFSIAFDPVLLRAISVSSGDAFGGLFIGGTIDNTLGLVTDLADALSGPVPGLSGDLWLARLEFQALAAGTANVDFSDLVLIDSSLNSIAATTQNSSVTITDTPEPATMLLTAIAVCVCLVGVRFNRSAAARAGRSC